MSLKVEVSLFVLSSEIEDRDEVEVGKWFVSSILISSGSWPDSTLSPIHLF
jgi:hypothetical protein